MTCNYRTHRRIVTPALHHAAVQQCAGVFHAGSNSDSVGDAGDRDGHGAVRYDAMAELAVGVLTPALNGAATQHCAGLTTAGSNSNGVGDAGDRDRNGTVRIGTVAELAVGVLTPALNRTAAQHGTGMVVTGADCFRDEICARGAARGGISATCSRSAVRRTSASG